MKTLLTSTTLIASLMTMTVNADDDLDSVIRAAKKEGAAYSVGMPGSWANWKGTWSGLRLRGRYFHPEPRYY